jgi:protein TonB
LPTATVALSLLAHAAALILLLALPSRRELPAPPTEAGIALLFEPAPPMSDTTPAASHDGVPASAEPALPEPALPEPALPAPPPPAVPEGAAPPPALPKQEPAPPAPPMAEPRPTPAPAAERPAAARTRSATRPRPAPASPHPPAETRPAAGASADSATIAPLVPPRPVAGMETNRAPTYPEAARRRGEQGRVMLRVSVSADGTPLDVSVAATSGHPGLDSAAVSAVRQWRFIPAVRAGTPEQAVAEIPIRFRLDD